MKKGKRILTLALTALMVFAMIPAAFAADYTITPGGSTSVTVSEGGSGSIDGTVSVSGGATVKYSSSETGGINDKGTFFLFNSGTKRVTVTLTAPAAAKVGETYTVTVNYTLYDEKGEKPAKKEVKKTVEVAAAAVVSTGKADSSKLQALFDQINALNPADYTGKTWEAVEAGVETATKAIESKNQADIDLAEKELTEAVGALVLVDRTALQNAIAGAEAYGEKSDSSIAWMALHKALKNGEDLLLDGDQTAVDAAAEAVQTALADVQEVSSRRSGGLDLWQLLFFISLALNAILMGLVVLVLLRKIKNRKDSTPLVDYDITDDEASELSESEVTPGIEEDLPEQEKRSGFFSKLSLRGMRKKP